MYGPYLVIRSRAPLLTRSRYVAVAERVMRVGQALNMAYVSRLALEPDSTDALMPLLGALAAKARSAGIDYLVISLPAAHWCCSAIGRLALHQTESILYAVRWPDDPPIELPVALPYVEAALL